MFKRADLIDLYSMADPNKCNDYIVLSADAIGQIFSQVNLFPKEKGGTLYFQSIEGIKRMTGADKDLKTANCTKIAFFFIRIFQTFGALTLSVIDSSLPATDPVAQVDRKEPLEKYEKAFARPLPGFNPAPRGLWGGALVAGSTSRSASFYISQSSGPEDYRILNQYLVAPSGGSADTSALYFDKSSIQIPQETLYDGVPLTRVLKGQPEPMIVYSFKDVTGSKTITARLTISISEGVYIVGLTNIRISNAPAANVKQISTKLIERYRGDKQPEDTNGLELPDALSRMLKQIVSDEIGFSIVQFLYDKRYTGSVENNTRIAGTQIDIVNPSSSYRQQLLPIVYSDTIRVDNKSVPITIKAALEIKKGSDSITGKTTYSTRINFDRVKVTPDYTSSMIDFAPTAFKVFTAQSESTDPVNDKGEKIPAYLQKRFDVLLKPAKEGKARAGTQYTRQGIPKPYTSEKIPPQLRVDGLWSALAKDPPVKAHCVARALQLLNVAAIRGSMSNTDFTNVCNTRFPYITDKSLPARGRPIVEEMGIAALANLFVDGLQNNMPLITDGPKYGEFLKKLRMSFYGYESLGETPDTKSMGEIVDQPLTMCEGQNTITIPGPLRSGLRSTAVKLINRQAQHLRSVMALIYRLFNASKVKSGVFEIHPDIMAGGMDAVNRVAVDARELLIQYYSDCESTYKDGVLLVQQSQVIKTRAPPPSAPSDEKVNDRENDQNDPDEPNI